MAEKCFPLENTMYTAEDAQMWFATRTSGVYAGTHLPVTAAGTMDLSVGTGIAWLHYDMFVGCVYGNTDIRTLTVEMSDAQYDRIDRVCVRLEMLNNRCYLYIKKGTAASSPVPPALQRDSAAYEISVAQIYVGVGVTGINAGDITDERLDADVCGLMSDGVTGIDTSVIQAQFREMLQQLHDENIMRDPGVLRIDEIMSLTETEKGNVYTSLGLDAESLGGIQMELLWENASPASQFVSQKLTVSHEEFKLLLFNTSESTSSGNYTNSVLVPGEEAMIYGVNGSTGMCSRLVSFGEETINIGSGYKATSGWVKDDTLCIPLKIYGVK